MNPNDLLATLDQVDALLADIARTRSAAVRAALLGDARAANAQVCLMNDLIDSLVLRGIEAVDASGPNLGVPSCLS